MPVMATGDKGGKRSFSSSRLAFVVLLIASVGPLLGPVGAVNTIRYPKYAEANMTSSDDCSAGTSLAEAREVCAGPTDLIQAISCACFSCAQPESGKYVVSAYPDLSLCDRGADEDDFYIAHSDGVDGSTRLYTYLEGNGSSSDPSAPLARGDLYVGCITRELYEFMRAEEGVGGAEDVAAGGLYTLHIDRNELVTTPIREAEDGGAVVVRLWDLSAGCQESWHPVLTDGGPSGQSVDEYSDTSPNLVSLRGAALYCKEGEGAECDSRVWVAYVPDRYEGQEEFFPVDRFYKQSTCVADLSTLDGVDFQFSLNGSEVLTSVDCRNHCRDNLMDVALVTPEECYCVEDAAATLPASARLSTWPCWPCTDSDDQGDPFDCGNMGGSMSLYFVLEDGPHNPENHNFDYWQCVRSDLYNPVEDVLPEPLYKVQRYNGSASLCLGMCQEEDFDVAMIRNVNVTDPDHLYDCYCLSERYRFRSVDVHYNCLNYWCPSITGPCVPAELDPLSDQPEYYMAAVYCRGKTACGTGLLADNEVAGICEEEGAGAKVADDRISATEYLQCVHTPESDLWEWRLRSCQGDLEVFDRDSGECVVPAQDEYCQQTDSRGSQWVAEVGETAVKECAEDLGEGATGNAFWYCDLNTAPLFDTPEPDRSDCQEPWVGDINDMVENNETAKDITTYILDNLESSEEALSGGGLLELTSAMEDISELQARQLLEGEGAAPGEDPYAVGAYGVVDALLASVQSWKEVPDDQERYLAASSLLRQVDEVGALTLAELSSLQEGGAQECTTVSEEYSNYYLLTSKLVRARDLATADDEDDDGDDDHFVFTGEGVEVTVPVSFLRYGGAAAAQCGSVVAASLAVDFAETQMFPDSPPSDAELEQEGDGGEEDEVQDGLHGVLVDFTSLGVTAADLEGKGGDAFEDDVVIVFDHMKRREKLAECVWWDAASLRWSSQGCELDRRRSTASTAVCRCNHLTNFAIIFGADDADDPVLSILSIVLGTISCACFVVTITMTHLFVHGTGLDRRQLVELNRNYCLLFGQLFFLTVVGARDRLDPLACAFVTAITHYIWLAAFTWTALEGYLLFVRLVIVFDRGHTGRSWHFYSAGYGVPLLGAGVTVAAAAAADDVYSGYFREDACWLDEGYIWAFIGPVAVVLVLNTGILVKALVEAYRVNRQRSPDGGDAWLGVRSWVRNFLLLSYVLGVTWAIGFFNSLGRPSQFIFVVLNASVGISVLVQAVLFNKKMREASTKAWKSRSTSTKSTKLSVPAAGSDKSVVKKKISNATSLNFNGKRFVSTKKRY